MARRPRKQTASWRGADSTQAATTDTRPSVPARCASPNARGDELALAEDEIAFYDALETNDRAVQCHHRLDAAGARPPNKQKNATQTFLEQAEVLSADWAA